MTRVLVLLFTILFLLSFSAFQATAVELVRVGILPDSPIHEPVWSAQEDQIACVTRTGIFLTAKDGTNPRVFYPYQSGTNCSQVSFSHDGRYLVFTINGTVKMLEIATALEVSLALAPGTVADPVFSPDGQYLAYSILNEGEDGALYFYNLTSKTNQKIDTVSARFLHFTASGDYLYYLKGNNLSQLRRVSTLFGSVSETLIDMVSYASYGTSIHGFDISADGSFVAFLTNNPYFPVYSLYSFQLGERVLYHASDVRDIDLTAGGELAYISEDFQLKSLDLLFMTREILDTIGQIDYLNFNWSEDTLAYIKSFSNGYVLNICKFTTPQLPTIPAPPVVVDSSSHSLTLSTVADGNMWHRLYVNGVAFAAISPAEQLQYNLDNLMENSEYSLQFSAISNGVESALSEITNAQTGFIAPPVPKVTVSDIRLDGFRVNIVVDQRADAFEYRIDGVVVYEGPEMIHEIVGLNGQQDYGIEVRSKLGEMYSESVSLTVRTLDYPPFSPTIALPSINGRILAGPVYLFATVTGEYIQSIIFQLNDQPFQNEQYLNEEGNWTYSVIVTGLNGTVVTQSINFTVDSTPPEIIFVNFKDGDQVSEGFIPEITIIEEHIQQATLTLDGQIVAAQSMELVPGEHLIRMDCSDQAGNMTSRSATIIVATPLPVLTSLILPSEIADSQTSVEVSGTYSIYGATGILRLVINDPSTTIVNLDTTIDNSGTFTLQVNCPVDGFPAGTYNIIATVVDNSGQISVPVVKNLVVIETPDEPTMDTKLIAAEEKLDRMLVLGDQKKLKILQENCLSEQIFFKSFKNEKSFLQQVYKGKYGIFAVDAKTVTNSTLSNLLKRCEEGDCLILYNSKWNRIQPKEKGLLVDINELNNLSLTDLLTAYQATPIPAPSAQRIRQFRVNLVEQSKEDEYLSGEVVISSSEGRVFDWNWQEMEDETNQIIPVSGLHIYCEQMDLTIPMQINLTEVTDQAQLKIVLEAIESTFDTAIELVTLLNEITIKKRSSKGLLKNLIRLAEKLLKIHDGHKNDLAKAGIILWSMKIMITRLEQKEKSSYTKIKELINDLLLTTSSKHARK